MSVVCVNVKRVSGLRGQILEKMYGISEGNKKTVRNNGVNVRIMKVSAVKRDWTVTRIGLQKY